MPEVPALPGSLNGRARPDRLREDVARVLAAPDDDRAIGMVKTEVEQLCRQFPLYDFQLLNG